MAPVPPPRAPVSEHAGGLSGGLRRHLAPALVVAFVLAGILTSSAMAVRGHEFAAAFGWGVASGAAELQRCESKALPAVPPVCLPGLAGEGEGQFDSPNGIAVNESTGEVYVVDRANDRVEIFDASGSKFEGEFDGSGTHLNEGVTPAGFGGGPEEVPTGKFNEPEGIAVDNDPASPSFGDVYVVDTNGHAGTPAEPAVIDKFSESGKYIGQITRNPDGISSEDGFRRVYGVAVDPRGEVWVEEQNLGFPGFAEGAAHYSAGEANAWIDFRGTRAAEVSSFTAPGFAVDGEASPNLYVHNSFPSNRLAKFDGEGNLLSAELDEEAPTAVAVELSSGNVYVSHAASVHRLNAGAVSPELPNGESLESLEAPGTGSLSGVAVNDRTLTVYVADAQANRVDVFTPEPPNKPRIEAGSTAVADVSAGSASFAAEVNPRSEPSEAPSSYRFEYGPCASPATCPQSPYPQSTPVPEGVLQANYEADPVSAHPQDLAPRTVYHVRLSARNSHGEGLGEELIFTTQGTGPAPALPDQRQWELVSSPDKHGAVLQPIEDSGLVQAAGSGGAISYLANSPSEAQPAGFSQTVQILSRRGGGAWESQDIATPHEATVSISIGQGRGEYRFFSEDLSRAVLHPFGPFTQAISPQASERTSFLREDFPAGDPAHPCAASCFRPLVSGCPEAGEPCAKAVEEVANVPAGTQFGEEEVVSPCAEVCGPYFLGASPDASHVVVLARTPLTEDAPARKAGEAEGGELYEWAAGKLALVSVLPRGQAVMPGADAQLGSGEGYRLHIARHAISTDGSRVIWSEANGAHHLYLRRAESGEAQTIQLDAPEAACTAKGKCKGEAHPFFQTASANGSRVFFSDSQPLTQGSGNSDLYECEIEEAEGELSCRLSDLTPQGAGEAGAGVIGLAVGAAEDGSAIYFTANGKLSADPGPRGEGAVAGDCSASTTSGDLESETAPERCNLYVRSGGQTRLVAVLSGADFPAWSLPKGLRTLSARVSPSGRYLAFMSRRSLSGYDNRDAQSGRPDQEVFLYDSAGDGGAGELSCASCDPSGARPRGVQYEQINIENGGLAGGSGVWPASAWIAASVPGWTAISFGEGFALHQARYLSDSGRLFFDAADAVVSKDTNKTEDVYEHEPAGTGSCSEASSGFDPASGGCVALISSGTSSEESALLDASESGDDVFFLTRQRLLPGQDLDTALDVYDAHSCSASSPCLPAPPAGVPPCEGDACQSPGAPPEDQTPGSLTFQGPGNPAPPAAPVAKPKQKKTLKCPRGKTRNRHGKCVKAKRKAKRTNRRTR